MRHPHHPLLALLVLASCQPNATPESNPDVKPNTTAKLELEETP